MKKMLLVGLSLLLAACGAGMNGTYEDKLGLTEYEFKSDGTVYQRTFGLETESRYEVDDGKVRIFDKDNEDSVRLVFTRQDDGSLKGPMGLSFKKKEE